MDEAAGAANRATQVVFYIRWRAGGGAGVCLSAPEQSRSVMNVSVLGPFARRRCALPSVPFALLFLWHCRPSALVFCRRRRAQCRAADVRDTVITSFLSLSLPPFLPSPSCLLTLPCEILLCFPFDPRLVKRT